MKNNILKRSISLGIALSFLLVFILNFEVNATTQNSGRYNGVQIEAGAFASYMLLANGTVNYSGTGILNGTSTFSSIIALDNVEQVASGNNHALVLKTDGTVWGWGRVTPGIYQLSDIVGPNVTAPTQLTSITDVKKLYCGSSYNMYIKSDNTVWGWGQNLYGQLGNGNSANQALPVRAGSLTNIIDLGIGNYNAFALDINGKLYGWGDGNNWCNNVVQSSPYLIGTYANAISLAAGDRHLLMLDSNGDVWSMGLNDHGQLGNGNNAASATLTKIQSLNNIVAIEAGRSSNFALKSDGTVWAWGANFYGQLGLGDTTNRNTPQKITSLSNIVSISTKSFHAIALDSYGKVWTWGSYDEGQLGNGATALQLLPVHVMTVTFSSDTPETIVASNSFNYDVIAGQSYKFAVPLQNIESFNGKSIKVIYEKNMLEMTDACALSFDAETSIGVLAGTDISITEINEGNIRFICQRLIPTDKTWSGIVNAIEFKALQSGQIAITIQLIKN